MPFCRKCGASMDEVARFCSQCAAPVDEAATPAQPVPPGEPSPTLAEAAPSPQAQAVPPVTTPLTPTPQAAVRPTEGPSAPGRQRSTRPWYLRWYMLIVFPLVFVVFYVVGLIDKSKRRTDIGLYTIIACVLLGLGAISMALPHQRTPPPTTPSGVAVYAATQTPAATPKPNDKLPMRVIRERVRAILTANVDHYAKLLAAGEQALGPTQYANANAGLNAFNDPNSAASKFRAYQGGQGTGPTNDLSYLGGFKHADSYYTAADEPTSAINAWENDIGDAQGAFGEFTDVGTGWQIKENTTAQLRAAERQITDDLARARRDIAKIVAGR